MTKSLRPLRKILPLVLATVLLASACGANTENQAFSVDGSAYMRSSFDELTSSLIDAGQFTATDGKIARADAVKILRAMIRYEAFLKFMKVNKVTINEADRQSLLARASADEDFKKLPESLQDTLVNLNLVEVTLQKFKTPDEASIEKLYVTSPASAGVLCLSHILVKTEVEAKTVLSDLDGGAKFADVAAKQSIEPGADKSGGALKNGAEACQSLVSLQSSFDPDFMRGAVSAKPGVATGPVKSSFGFHVILSHPYSEVKTSVLKIVKEDPGNILLTGYLSAVDITVNSAYGKWDGALGTIQ